MISRPIIEVAKNTWLISDYRLANLYLVAGDERALLIDTGCGLGPIEDQVRELIGDKPLTIWITHLHGDHSLGVHLFDAPAFMHEDEASLYEATKDLYGVEIPKDDFRDMYVMSRGPVRNPDADVAELKSLIRAPKRVVTFETFRDGDTIDLGNRVIEVIHTPGHSLGSCCFLDRSARILYSGDTLNDSLLLNIKPFTTSVATYRKSMEKLAARADEFDWLALGHDALELAGKEHLYDYLEGTEKILNGTADGLIRKSALHSGTGFPYKSVLIWFSPDAIHELPNAG